MENTEGRLASPGGDKESGVFESDKLSENKEAYHHDRSALQPKVVHPPEAWTCTNAKNLDVPPEQARAPKTNPEVSIMLTDTDGISSDIQQIKIERKVFSTNEQTQQLITSSLDLHKHLSGEALETSNKEPYDMSHEREMIATRRHTEETNTRDEPSLQIPGEYNLSPDDASWLPQASLTPAISIAESNEHTDVHKEPVPNDCAVEMETSGVQAQEPSPEEKVDAGLPTKGQEVQNVSIDGTTPSLFQHGSSQDQKQFSTLTSIQPPHTFVLDTPAPSEPVEGANKPTSNCGTLEIGECVITQPFNQHAHISEPIAVVEHLMQDTSLSVQTKPIEEENTSPEDTDTSLPQAFSNTESNEHTDVHKEPVPNDCTVEMIISGVQAQKPSQEVHNIFIDGATPSLFQPRSSYEHNQFSKLTSVQPPDTFVLDTPAPIELVEEANKPTSNCGTLEIEECVITQLLNQQWTPMSSELIAVVEHLMQDASLSVHMKPIEEDNIYLLVGDGLEYIDTASPDQHPTTEDILNRAPSEVSSVEENNTEEMLDAMATIGGNMEDTAVGRPAERTKAQLREESCLQPELIRLPDTNKLISIADPCVSSERVKFDREDPETVSYTPAEDVQTLEHDEADISTNEPTQQLTTPARHGRDIDKLETEDGDSDPYNSKYEREMIATRMHTEETNTRDEPSLQIPVEHNSSPEHTDASLLSQATSDSNHVDGPVSNFSEKHVFMILWVETDTPTNMVTNCEGLFTPREHTSDIPLLGSQEQHNSALQEIDLSPLPPSFSTTESNEHTDVHKEPVPNDCTVEMETSGVQAQEPSTEEKVGAEHPTEGQEVQSVALDGVTLTLFQPGSSYEHNQLSKLTSVQPPDTFVQHNPSPSEPDEEANKPTFSCGTLVIEECEQWTPVSNGPIAVAEHLKQDTSLSVQTKPIEEENTSPEDTDASLPPSISIAENNEHTDVHKESVPNDCTVEMETSGVQAQKPSQEVHNIFIDGATPSLFQPGFSYDQPPDTFVLDTLSPSEPDEEANKYTSNCGTLEIEECAITWPLPQQWTPVSSEPIAVVEHLMQDASLSVHMKPIEEDNIHLPVGNGLEYIDTVSPDQHPTTEAILNRAPSEVSSVKENNTEEMLDAMATIGGNMEDTAVGRPAERTKAQLREESCLQPELTHSPEANELVHLDYSYVSSGRVVLDCEHPETTPAEDVQTLEPDGPVISTNEPTQQLTTPTGHGRDVDKLQIEDRDSELYNSSYEKEIIVTRGHTEETNTRDEPLLQIPGEYHLSPEDTDASLLSQATSDSVHVDVLLSPKGYTNGLHWLEFPKQSNSLLQEIDSSSLPLTISIGESSETTIVQKEPIQNDCVVEMNTVKPPDMLVLDTPAPIELVEEANKATSNCGTLEIEECVITQLLNQQWTPMSSEPIAVVEHLMQDASLSVQTKPIEEDNIHLLVGDGLEYIDTASPDQHPTTEDILNRAPSEVSSVEENNTEEMLDAMATIGGNMEDTAVGRPAERIEAQLREESCLQPELTHSPEANELVHIAGPCVSIGRVMFDCEHPETVLYAPAEDVQTLEPDGPVISTNEPTQPLITPAGHGRDIDKLEVEGGDSIKTELYNSSYEREMIATRMHTEETNTRDEPLLQIPGEHNSSPEHTDASLLSQATSDSNHVDGPVSNFSEKHVFMILWVETDTNMVTNCEGLFTPREHTSGIPLLGSQEQHNSALQEIDLSSLPPSFSNTENNEHTDVHKESVPNDCTVQMETSGVQAQEPSPEEKVDAGLPTEGQEVQSVALEGVTLTLFQPGSSYEHNQCSILTSIQPPDTFVLDTPSPSEPDEEANKPTSNCGTLEIEECVITWPLPQQWTPVSSEPIAVVEHLMQDASLSVHRKPIEEDNIAGNGPEYSDTASPDQHPTTEAILNRAPSEVSSVEENNTEEMLDAMATIGGNMEDTAVGRPAERIEAQLREESCLQPELIHSPEANELVHIAGPCVSIGRVMFDCEHPETVLYAPAEDVQTLEPDGPVISTMQPTHPLLGSQEQHNSALQEVDLSSLPQAFSNSESNEHTDVHKEPVPNDCTVEMETSGIQAQEPSPEKKVDAGLPTEGQEVQSVALDGVTLTLFQPGSSYEHNQFSILTSIQPPDTFVLDTPAPSEPDEETNKPTSNCGTLEIEECVITWPLNQHVSRESIAVVEHLMQDASLCVHMKPIEEDNIHLPVSDGLEYIDTVSPDQHPTTEAILNRAPSEVSSVEENNTEEMLDAMATIGGTMEDTAVGRPAERIEAQLREESCLQPELTHSPEANELVHTAGPCVSIGRVMFDCEHPETVLYAPAEDVQTLEPDGPVISTMQPTQQLTTPTGHGRDIDKHEVEGVHSITTEPYNSSYEREMDATRGHTEETNTRDEPLLHIPGEHNLSPDDASLLSQASLSPAISIVESIEHTNVHKEPGPNDRTVEMKTSGVQAQEPSPEEKVGAELPTEGQEVQKVALDGVALTLFQPGSSYEHNHFSMLNSIQPPDTPVLDTPVLKPISNCGTLDIEECVITQLLPQQWTPMSSEPIAVIESLMQDASHSVHMKPIEEENKHLTDGDGPECIDRQSLSQHPTTEAILNRAPSEVSIVEENNTEEMQPELINPHEANELIYIADPCVSSEWVMFDREDPETVSYTPADDVQTLEPDGPVISTNKPTQQLTTPTGHGWDVDKPDIEGGDSIKREPYNSSHEGEMIATRRHTEETNTRDESLLQIPGEYNLSTPSLLEPGSSYEHNLLTKMTSVQPPDTFVLDTPSPSEPDEETNKPTSNCGTLEIEECVITQLLDQQNSAFKGESLVTVEANISAPMVGHSNMLLNTSLPVPSKPVEEETIHPPVCVVPKNADAQFLDQHTTIEAIFNLILPDASSMENINIQGNLDVVAQVEGIKEHSAVGRLAQVQPQVKCCLEPEFNPLAEASMQIDVGDISTSSGRVQFDQGQPEISIMQYTLGKILSDLQPPNLEEDVISAIESTQQLFTPPEDTADPHQHQTGDFDTTSKAPYDWRHRGEMYEEKGAMKNDSAGCDSAGCDNLEEHCTNVPLPLPESRGLIIPLLLTQATFSAAPEAIITSSDNNLVAGTPHTVWNQLVEVVGSEYAERQSLGQHSTSAVLDVITERATPSELHSVEDSSEVNLDVMTPTGGNIEDDKRYIAGSLKGTRVNQGEPEKASIDETPSNILPLKLEGDIISSIEPTQQPNTSVLHRHHPREDVECINTSQAGMIPVFHTVAVPTASRDAIIGVSTLDHPTLILDTASSIQTKPEEQENECISVGDRLQYVNQTILDGMPSELPSEKNMCGRLEIVPLKLEDKEGTVSDETPEVDIMIPSMPQGHKLVHLTYARPKRSARAPSKGITRLAGVHSKVSTTEETLTSHLVADGNRLTEPHHLELSQDLHKTDAIPVAPITALHTLPTSLSSELHHIFTLPKWRKLMCPIDVYDEQIPVTSCANATTVEESNIARTTGQVDANLIPISAITSISLENVSLVQSSIGVHVTSLDGSVEVLMCDKGQPEVPIILNIDCESPLDIGAPKLEGVLQVTTTMPSDTTPTAPLEDPSTVSNELQITKTTEKLDQKTPTNNKCIAAKDNALEVNHDIQYTENIHPSTFETSVHVPHPKDTAEEVRHNQSQLKVSPTFITEDETSVMKEQCDPIDQISLVNNVLGMQTEINSYFVHVNFMMVPQPMFYTKCTIVEEVDAMFPPMEKLNFGMIGEDNWIIHQKETMAKDVTTSSFAHCEATSSKKEEYSVTQPPCQQPTSGHSGDVQDRAPSELPSVEKGNTERMQCTTVSADVGLCWGKQAEVANLQDKSALHVIHAPEAKNSASIQNQVVLLEEVRFDQEQPEVLVMSNIFNVSWLHCAEQQTAAEEHSQKNTHTQRDMTSMQHIEAAQGLIERSVAQKEDESMQIDERRPSDIMDYSRDKGEVVTHGVEVMRPLTMETNQEANAVEPYFLKGIHQPEVSTGTDITAGDIATEQMKSSVGQQNTAYDVQIHVSVQGDIIMSRVVDELSEGNSKTILSLQHQDQGADMRTNEAQKVPGITDVCVNNALVLAGIPVSTPMGQDIISSPVEGTRTAEAQGANMLHQPKEYATNSNEPGCLTKDIGAPLMDKRAAVSRLAGNDSFQGPLDLLSHAEHEGVDAEEVSGSQHSDEFKWRRMRVLRRKKTVPKETGDEKSELLPRPRSAAIERSIFSPLSKLITRPHSGLFESNASSPHQPTVQSQPHLATIRRNVTPHHDPILELGPDQTPPPNGDTPVLSGHKTSGTAIAAETKSSKAADRKTGFLRRKGALKNVT